MPAPERIPPGSLTDAELVNLLTKGQLTVLGQVGGASNAVLYCTVAYEGEERTCVYKPVAGEQPLWDFPDGTLAQREVAAYEISEAMGWGLVPPTVLRDGPYGEGMCQLWIEAPAGESEDGDSPLLALVEDEEPADGWKAVALAEVGEGRTALLVHADDPRLRRLAVLDAVINNGDRKGGHLLPAPGGRLYGIDHGVTFNADDKLRTLLWGWAGEPLTAEAVEVLGRLAEELVPGTALVTRLAELITAVEIDALRGRVEGLRVAGRHPQPSEVAVHTVAAGVTGDVVLPAPPGTGTPPRIPPVSSSAGRDEFSSEGVFHGSGAVPRFGEGRRRHSTPGTRKTASPARIPYPVRIRKQRPVTLMTCMPGPLLRSPPCLARAATFGSTTPRPADGSPLTPVPSPASTSAASRRTTRPIWVMRRPTTRSTSFSACGSTPSGRFTTSRM